MKRVLFFVNPNAGQGNTGFDLMGILQEFARRDWRIEVYPTRGPGELTEVIAREGWKYDMIVAAGGDGTLNETTSGLMRLPEDKRPPVGYIPRGTVNDISHSLGLSKNTRQAAEDIVTGEPYIMDVGSFNDRWFNYVAAFGAFTDVSYRTAQEDKRVLGRLAYLLDGVKSLSEIHPVKARVKVGSEVQELEVLLGIVASTNSVAGIRMPQEMEVLLNDGLFEVVLVKNIDSLSRLKDLAAALSRRDFSGDGIFVCKACHVEFEFDSPVDWTLDGEFGGSVKKAVIDNHRGAISIQVPKKKTKKRLPAAKKTGKPNQTEEELL